MSALILSNYAQTWKRSSPSWMLHSPEWELMSSKSLMFIGFISMMYQYSVPREVAKNAKLRIPQMPAAITRQPKVTFILCRWGLKWRVNGDGFNSCVARIFLFLPFKRGCAHYGVRKRKGKTQIWCGGYPESTEWRRRLTYPWVNHKTTRGWPGWLKQQQLLSVWVGLKLNRVAHTFTHDMEREDIIIRGDSRVSCASRKGRDGIKTYIIT